MVTLRPRDLRSRPRLEAVRPLPSEEATPPVTKMCFVVSATGFKSTSSREGLGVAFGPTARLGHRGGPGGRHGPRGGTEAGSLRVVTQQAVDLGSRRGRIANGHKRSRAV